MLCMCVVSPNICRWFSFLLQRLSEGFHLHFQFSLQNSIVCVNLYVMPYHDDIAAKMHHAMCVMAIIHPFAIYLGNFQLTIHITGACILHCK